MRHKLIVFSCGQCSGRKTVTVGDCEYPCNICNGAGYRLRLWWHIRDFIRYSEKVPELYLNLRPFGIIFCGFGREFIHWPIHTCEYCGRAFKEGTGYTEAEYHSLLCICQNCVDEEEQE